MEGWGGDLAWLARLSISLHFQRCANKLGYRWTCQCRHYDIFVLDRYLVGWGDKHYDGQVVAQKIVIADNPIDMMTKSFPTKKNYELPKFVKCKQGLWCAYGHFAWRLIKCWI